MVKQINNINIKYIWKTSHNGEILYNALRCFAESHSKNFKLNIVIYPLHDTAKRDGKHPLVHVCSLLQFILSFVCLNVILLMF